MKMQIATTMTSKMGAAAFIIAVGGAIACGGDGGNLSPGPADVSGTYSVSVTTQSNTCQVEGFKVGDMVQDVPLVIVQEGAMVDGRLQGVPAVFFELALGSNAFTGSVQGQNLSMTTFGTRSHSVGSCTFTLEAQIAAGLDRDVIRGDVRYRPHSNGHADCAVIEGCSIVQQLVGIRPPR